MSKREVQADMHSNIRSVKWLLVLLVLCLCLLFGSSCRQGDGDAEAPTVPMIGTEATCPTEEIPPTEATEPTETVLPTEFTESTEPATEGTTPPTENTEPPAVEPTVPETQPPMQIQISPDQAEVLLIPQKAKAFTLRDLTVPVEDDIYNYKTVHRRLDTGVPVTLAVKITNIPRGVAVTSVVFVLADNAELTNGQVYRPTGDRLSVDVPFLLANKQYYYRVGITFSDGTTKVLSSSFRTAAAPRLLSIDGIVNVRDIGGWKTTDGYVIRQGLLYRGSELDGAVKPEYKLTAEGLRQMREYLGIRTDLDLRSASEIGEYTAPLGADVSHIICDARPYASIFRSAGRAAVLKIFTALAEPDNYPVYMHCTYGMDRGGTVCFLLEALLGVSEADLQREYELSAMCYTWVDSESYRSLVAELKTWEGDTLQEKAEAFLLQCGITREQIDRIRQILLEKA